MTGGRAVQLLRKNKNSLKKRRQVKSSSGVKANGAEQVGEEGQNEVRQENRPTQLSKAHKFTG